MDNTKITGISMVSVYSSDYKLAYDFYVTILGLESKKDREAKGCYLPINDEMGLYMEGGYEKSETNSKSARIAFTFKVDSSAEMFNKLKGKGIQILQAEPIKVADKMYWFQCFDFEGNMVEFLGGE